MLEIEKIDGILMDLGVSSYQLDTPERGFTHNTDAPLDMRMDRRGELDAYTVVNTYSFDALKKVIYTYGEERFAPLRVVCNSVELFFHIGPNPNRHGGAGGHGNASVCWNVYILARSANRYYRLQ